MKKEIDKFTEALLSLDRLAAQKLLEEQSSHALPIKYIEDVVVVALERIGEEWLKGNLALSQVYMSGRICEQLVDSVLPPGAPDRKDKPKMAICVLSDHHGLGKTIVYSLLRASGFELLDYGFIEENELLNRLEEDNIKILLISVLMLPSALKIKNVSDRRTAKGLDVKIIVGGAPFRFDNQLWREVDADAMCETASSTVATIEKLIRGDK